MVATGKTEGNTDTRIHKTSASADVRPNMGMGGKISHKRKNIGVDPAHIAVRTRNLCADVKVQLTAKSLPLDRIAAVFHHRLVSIHPFANGNGRHARLMADLLLIRNSAERFTWGGNIADTAHVVRNRYIAALRPADAKDYRPLFEFVRS